MPSRDWFDDDDDHTMSRDRDHSDRMRDRDRHDERSGGFFGRGSRDYDERERNRPIGGWGGLMGNREREPERGEYRDRGEDRGERMGRHEDRHFGPDDYNRGIPMDETERLIASNKVEGTPVFDRHGDRLGSIHNFMVDKRRGHVVYAVLKHSSGFLGLGERYYPLDWDKLTYDTRLGGYHVDLVEDDLKSFGSFDSEGRWHSRDKGRRSDRDMDRDRGHRRDRSMREPW